MSDRISERAFEEAIECALLRNGPDSCLSDYDRSLCLIHRDTLDFLVATQPREWE